MEGGFSWLGLLSGTAITGLADRRKQKFHRRGAPSPGFLSPVSLKKAPPVEIFAWLPVGYKANKTGRGSVSLI